MNESTPDGEARDEGTWIQGATGKWLKVESVAQLKAIGQQMLAEQRAENGPDGDAVPRLVRTSWLRRGADRRHLLSKPRERTHRQDGGRRIYGRQEFD